MKHISKYIFFLSIFMLSQFIGKAQISLNGKITDSKDNSALNGASIYIPDIKTGAVSKADGSYEIKNIPNGTYLVEVSFVGFASQTKDVTVNGKSVIDFSLERSTIESPEVVVTGVASATEQQTNPAPVSIVQQNTLQETTSDNIID